MDTTSFTVPTVVIYHPDSETAAAIYWKMWTSRSPSHRLPTLPPLTGSPHKTSEFPKPVLAMVLGPDDPRKGNIWPKDYLSDVRGHRGVFSNCPLVIVVQTEFSWVAANWLFPHPEKEKVAIFDYRNPSGMDLGRIVGLIWEMTK